MYSAIFPLAVRENVHSGIRLSPASELYDVVMKWPNDIR